MANDCPAVQSCVDWSRITGGECYFPIGTFNLGTVANPCTIQLILPASVVNTFGPRLRGSTVQAESFGSVLNYPGTGIAVQGMGQQVSGIYVAPLNMRIENLVIQYPNAAPNGIALDLVNAGQSYINKLAIQAPPAGPTGSGLHIGIRCLGCNISWWYNVTISGQFNPTSFVDIGMYFGVAGLGSSGGQMAVRDSYSFMVREPHVFTPGPQAGPPTGAIPGGAAPGGQYAAPGMIFDGDQNDTTGTGFRFSNEGAAGTSMRLDNFIIRNNRFAPLGAHSDGDAPIVIDHTAGSAQMIIGGTFEQNEGACGGAGTCETFHDVQAANIRRTGNTVTVSGFTDYPNGCTFLQDGAGPYRASNVYKLQIAANDPSFPGGMKTVTAAQAAGGGPCTRGDPVNATQTAGVCPPIPCQQFTYTEPSPCAGAGACAAGTCTNCLGSAESLFSFGNAIILEKHNFQAAAQDGSQIVWQVKNNQMRPGWGVIGATATTWGGGLYMDYATAAENTPCTSNCAYTTIVAERNQLANTAETGYVQRNINSIWGAGTQTLAGQFTGPELQANVHEVWISALPTNSRAVGWNGTTGGSAVIVPSIQHWPFCLRAPLAAGALSVAVPDYQDNIYCKVNGVDAASSARGCWPTGLPVLQANQVYPGMIGNVTVNGTATDSVDVCGW